MKKKVLIVDDEQVCATFMSMALEAEGFEVKTANKAGDALRIGQEMQPDYLITDWMLKDDQDGIDVAKVLTASFPSMRVIFITGMALDLVEPKAASVPGHSVIVKPVDLDEVIKLLGPS